MDGGDEIVTGGPRLIGEGDWAGWHYWGDSDPFEHQSGPYYFRDEPDGTVRCAFRAEKQHMNGGSCVPLSALVPKEERLRSEISISSRPTTMRSVIVSTI